MSWASFVRQGEGVAYRGRALVELETVLTDEPIKNSVSPLEDEDVINVQVLICRLLSRNDLLSSHGNRFIDCFLLRLSSALSEAGQVQTVRVFLWSDNDCWYGWACWVWSQHRWVGAFFVVLAPDDVLVMQMFCPFVHSSCAMFPCVLFHSTVLFKVNVKRFTNLCITHALTHSLARSLAHAFRAPFRELIRLFRFSQETAATSLTSRWRRPTRLRATRCSTARTTTTCRGDTRNRACAWTVRGRTSHSDSNRATSWRAWPKDWYECFDLRVLPVCACIVRVRGQFVGEHRVPTRTAQHLDAHGRDTGTSV